jgi:hypothetical protein
VGSEIAVLGTPILPYSTSFYGHVVAGAFLVGAVYLLSRAREPSRADALASGACLVAAVGSEYLVAVYHSVCFGAPWRTGYSFITLPQFAAGHASGLLGVRGPTLEALWGLSFGGRRGLFYVAPVALVGLVGLVLAALRGRDPGARVGLACVVALTWFNASYYMWWGGAAAGPRHLVPVMGFLAIGVAFAWRSLPGRVLVVVLGAVSFANVLVITAVGLEAPEFDDVLRRYAWPAFLEGKVARLSGASSLGLKLGFRSWVSLWPLGLWLVVGQIYVLRLLRASQAPRAAAGPVGEPEGQPG